MTTWLPRPGAIGVAPMVGVTTLAFRLFAVQHGAEFVCTEELVAAKLVHCRKEVQPCPPSLLELARLPSGTQLLEFASYATSSNQQQQQPDANEGKPSSRKRTVVFATFVVPDELRSQYPYPEGAPLIAQLGVSDPAQAAAAAAMVKPYVNGIDINMCCPQRFSVSTGMGITLMTDVPRAVKILKAVRAAVGGETMPVSFKTRLFEDVAASVAQITECIQQSEASIGTITIHARYRSQRSVVPPKTSLAVAVKDALRVVFPHLVILFNGSVGCTGFDGGGTVGGGAPGVAVMSRAVCSDDNGLGFDGGVVARDAMWNPTIFSDDGQYCDDVLAVHRALLRYQLLCGTPFAWIKYHTSRVFGLRPLQLAHPGLHDAIVHAKSVEMVCVALGMDEAVASQSTVAHRDLVRGNDDDSENEALM